MSLSLEADSCAMLLDPRTVSYISLFSLFMPKGKAFYYSNAKRTKTAYLCNKHSHGKEKWFNQPLLWGVYIHWYFPMMEMLKK
jgi:hypothetical protein